MAVHTNSYLYSFTPFCLERKQNLIIILGTDDTDEHGFKSLFVTKTV